MEDLCLNQLMFTGVIDQIGTFRKSNGDRFVFTSSDGFDALEVGGSVSVNGTCLTLVEFENQGEKFSVDVSEETRRRSNLGKLNPGDRVNLELPLEASGLAGRLDGHIVQGHVDTLGKIGRISRKNGDRIFRISTSRKFEKYLVEKGSVAVDGISLTPFSVTGGSFSVSIIPHTFDNTTLKYRRSGAEVNVEFDLLAKYTIEGGEIG
ncbi:riboflavin synthase [Candidatus Bipolaricaulota bacterium]|nr:riboflavin synthase [Candidatus Bipolaricaulota bacterium]